MDVQRFSEALDRWVSTASLAWTTGTARRFIFSHPEAVAGEPDDIEEGSRLVGLTADRAAIAHQEARQIVLDTAGRLARDLAGEHPGAAQLVARVGHLARRGDWQAASAIVEEVLAALDVVSAEPGEPESARGVSLHDAAERMRPGDREGQQELMAQWRASSNPKLPAPIGKCPGHKQRNLYQPAAILRFLKAVEGTVVVRDFAFSKHFSQVQRPPRP